MINIMNKSMKVIAGLGLASAMMWGTNAVAEVCAPNHSNARSAPGVQALMKETNYLALYAPLKTYYTTLSNDMSALQAAETAGSGQVAAYDQLVTDATALLATSSATGKRLVVADPDGTVVYDSHQTTCTVGGGAANVFSCYLAKGINENHNTRVSIMVAESWSCGLGAERKFSTTVNAVQSYVAVQLGTHLNGYGVARFGVTE